MNELPIGSSMDDMREIMGEQINMLDGSYDGDTVKYYKPKRLQPNNIRCKEKQIAKRRAKNKNKKR
jgi:hypothetical protein